MSVDENKAIVQRQIEAFNQQNLDAFDELATPELAQRFKDITRQGYATFEGHHITVTDMIAENDKVVVRVTTRGGHSGEFEGIPPTGKQWTNTGVLFYRLAHGKIVEFDALFDVLGHLKQLGATITPPAEMG